MIKTKQLVVVWLAIGLTLASALVVTSCASAKKEKEQNIIIGVANPFIDSPTLQESAKLVGFSIELPQKEQLPAWIEKTIYRSSTVDTKLLEIIFTSEENPTQEIRIRKAISDKDDISGDFNNYEKEEIIILDEKTVNTKSNGDKMYLATWRDGDYSYSIRNSNGAQASDFESLISIIK